MEFFGEKRLAVAAFGQFFTAGLQLVEFFLVRLFVVIDFFLALDCDAVAGQAFFVVIGVDELFEVYASPRQDVDEAFGVGEIFDEGGKLFTCDFAGWFCLWRLL